MSKSSEPKIDFPPLTYLSLDSCVQSQHLRLLGDQILEITSTWTDDTKHDFQRAHTYFWFWILGAYEFVRTLNANEKYISERLHPDLEKLERDLGFLRMPFAKQEPAGQPGRPIYADASVLGFGSGMIFETMDRRFESTDLINRIFEFIDKIERQDILGEIPVNRPDHFRK